MSKDTQSSEEELSRLGFIQLPDGSWKKLERKVQPLNNPLKSVKNSHKVSGTKLGGSTWFTKEQNDLLNKATSTDEKDFVVVPDEHFKVVTSGYANIEPVSNKKIKNATKCKQDGLTFDSRLELYCYNMFKKYDIKFELKRTYCIQEGFRYKGKKIQPITLTPDFFLPEHNIITDTKGFSTPSATIKFKMLKFMFWNQLEQSPNGMLPEIVILTNKKDVETFIYRLLKE